MAKSKLKLYLLEQIRDQLDKASMIDKDDFEEEYLEELSKVGELKKLLDELECLEDIAGLYEDD